MNNSRVKVVNDLLHLVQFGLRIDRLYDSSEHLKKITPVELHVLKLVCERPDLILQEIRQELGIPQSTLTNVKSFSGCSRRSQRSLHKPQT